MRAAWVGLAFALLLLYFTNKLHVFKDIFIAILIIIIPLIVYLSFYTEDIKQTRPYTVYEHLLSFADFSGTGTYKNKDSTGTGANNQFRLIWWQTVIDQTIKQGPILGLGFGYDLSSQFYLRYYNVLEEKFSTKSPDSIVLTAFGRLGFLGSAAIGFIIFNMLYQTFLELYLIRTLGTLTSAFKYWCMIWLLFISSCFGVVLEGPMGAIVFWVLLGLANSLSTSNAEYL